MSLVAGREHPFASILASRGVGFDRPGKETILRPLNRRASSLAVALIAAASATMPAGAASYRRHHAYHHRHASTRDAGGHVAPAFAPPEPVNGGLLGLSGPLIPGYPVGGGVLGTGVANGTGLLGIGFLGL